MSAVITKTCRSPDDNVKSIVQEGIHAIGTWAGQGDSERPNPFKQFGLKIDPGLVSVPAREINPPNLRFSSPEPVALEANLRGQWRLNPDWAFLTNDKIVSGQPFFLIPPNYKASTELQHFWTHYTKHEAPSLGNLPTNFNQSNTRTIHDISSIENAVSEAVHKRPSIVIMVLPNNNKKYQSHYALFKSMMDQDSGIPSLCLNSKKLGSKNRPLAHRAQPTDERSDIANYAYNVGMKLNIRLGNANHSIETDAFEMFPKNQHGAIDTLILGADVIHPAARRIKGVASIAAVVGSVNGDFAKYRGSMRIQPYDPTKESKEIIDDANMEAMARERLDAWKNVNNRYPGNILYYRDGVGDSQFNDVLNKEVEMIRAAYKKAVHKTPQADQKLKITTVVVIKRHNVQLYPSEKGRKTDTGNCLPGTVVDSGITHPYNFDFFLVSHDAVHGTARPTHYVVLQNEMGFNAASIQDLTHKLCYTYQRSTTSVSYIPPAYYADRLCERGRCYLRTFFDCADELEELFESKVKEEIGNAWARGGRKNGNPWHPAMDEKMFWM